MALQRDGSEVDEIQSDQSKNSVSPVPHKPTAEVSAIRQYGEAD